MLFVSPSTYLGWYHALDTAVVAQSDGAHLPDGSGGGILFWLVGAAVILGLWFLISRTRKRSYDAYWERRRREEALRRNDPDMAHPDPDDDPRAGPRSG
jgi:hypothetical protein